MRPIFRRMPLAAGALLLAAGTAFAAPAKTPAEPGQLAAATSQATSALPQNARIPVALPGALSDADVTRYREIFRLQRDGDFTSGEPLIRALQDPILVGHVLRQRYLHPAYRASYDELADWLQRYGDHPDADRLISLANQRRPKKNAAPLAAPTYGSEAKRVVDELAPPPPDETQRAQNALLARTTAMVREGRADDAETLLNQPSTMALLTKVQHDRAIAEIGMVQFLRGIDDRALQVAISAMSSGDAVPLAYWVAGLASVRLGDRAGAAGYFENYSRASPDNGWNQSAGAFWAARMHLLTKKPAEVERWLKVAAEQQRTFYGLLGRRALGINALLDWSDPLISEADVLRIQSLPGGRRSLALVQVGEIPLAEDEVRHAVNGADPMLARSLMAVADYTGMPNTSIRASLRLMRVGGIPSNRAFYPLPPFKPEDGWKVDRALVWGFMRQESLFNPRALSSASARGLMQLMPATATYIANVAGLPVREGFAVHDPDYNTSLGQAYLTYLMDKPDIDGDLFKLAASYNGGIGNVRKWTRDIKHLDDPLMFIESIPARETRSFIQRVLSNYWLYQQRLGQATLSLDAVVAGSWPRYIPQDGSNGVMAQQDAPR